jgi:hypothetical protein
LTPPVQVPFCACSSSPTFAVPEIAGAAVLVGPERDEMRPQGILYAPIT